MTHILTNHEREVLVEKIAVLLDRALTPTKFGKVVKDGDMEPIYDLIKHYQHGEHTCK